MFSQTLSHCCLPSWREPCEPVLSCWRALGTLSGKCCVNLLISVIDPWATVYKTETSPAGISLFHWAARDTNVTASTHCQVQTPSGPQGSLMTLPSLNALGGGRWQGIRRDLSLGNMQYQILSQTSALSLGRGHWPHQTFKTCRDVVCTCPVVEEDRRNTDSEVLNRNLLSWWQQEGERDMTPAKACRVQVTLKKFDSWLFL